MNRRDFLKKATAGAIGLTFSPELTTAAEKIASPDQISENLDRKRKLRARLIKLDNLLQ